MTTPKTIRSTTDMKLEVVLLGVSDVDRAKAFYENLGWRLDIDIAAGDFRFPVCLSECSGEGGLLWANSSRSDGFQLPIV